MNINIRYIIFSLLCFCSLACIRIEEEIASSSGIELYLQPFVKAMTLQPRRSVSQTVLSSGVHLKRSVYFMVMAAMVEASLFHRTQRRHPLSSSKVK